jgi:uncharacterized protein YyaL (SSP411 family)
LNDTLLKKRSQRIRPSTDDKCLTSWNAMLMDGLCDAFIYLQDQDYLDMAEQIAEWLEKHILKSDGKLFRCYYHKRIYIDGFLDDYAFSIQGFISLYQATFKVKWLQKAYLLMDYVLNHFCHPSSALFCYTEHSDELIARKMEVHDNVIPASNSVMARNLFQLGNYFARPDWVEKSRDMVSSVYEGMEQYGSGYSNWADVLRLHLFGNHTICGAIKNRSELLHIKRNGYEVLLCASEEIPIMRGKNVKSNPSIYYVCHSNGVCLAPLTNAEAVIKATRQTILGA